MDVEVSATLQRKIITSLQRPKGVLQLMLTIYYLDHISEWEFNLLILSAFRIEPQRISIPPKPRETSGNEKLPEFSDAIREPWE